MERTIIQGIKRLRVLTPYDYDNMDELVQDLSHALEESSCSRASGSKNKKGRSWKWRSKSTGNLATPGSSLPKSSAVSEDSESSLDRRMRCRMDMTTGCPQVQSDSDDIILPRHQHFASWRQYPANMAESDSVNENFLPMRIHRRKRKFKRMAVDPQPVVHSEPIAFQTVTITSQRMRKMKSIRALKNKAKLSKMCEADVENLCSTLAPEKAATFCGKRKRCMRERSIEYMGRGECLSTLPATYSHHEDPFGVFGQPHAMEYEDTVAKDKNMEGSSSSLSSSESDGGIFTNDEAREADDEQSDFFHEPGPACGIPGIDSWWEDHENDSSDTMDAKFEVILTGSFHHMSEMSKQAYHANVNRLMSRTGREIRAGRRRLGKSRAAFSVVASVNDKVSRLMQESFPNELMPQGMSLDTVVNRSSVGDIKRRRRTPPLGPVVKGFIGGSAEPIPDTNVGNKILRNMGWEPGSGLGAQEQGIQVPIVAYIRDKHQGLGYGMSPNHSPPPSHSPPPPPPPSPQPDQVELSLSERHDALSAAILGLAFALDQAPSSSGPLSMDDERSCSISSTPR